MADLLSIGSSGINVYQRALATVSNNIANLNTDGYSRQTTEIRREMGTLAPVLILIESRDSTMDF
jgi:flagellar hook-associated protein FlgK